MMRVNVIADDENCRSCRHTITTNPETPALGWYDKGFLYCDTCGNGIQKHQIFYRKAKR